MSLQKDQYPVCFVGGCGHVMLPIAWPVWATATEDGAPDDYYIPHEDKARGAAS